MIFLPQPPECWDYRHPKSFPVKSYLFIEENEKILSKLKRMQLNTIRNER
jgi:hypothetical protein